MMIVEDMVPVLSLQDLLFLNAVLNTLFHCAVSSTEPRVASRNDLFEISTNKGEGGWFAKFAVFIAHLHCLEGRSPPRCCGQ